MATNSAEPAVTTTPADPHQDDFSGVYGFFRRHQKKLLYTAGLFTLLTFSVTGPMLALIDNLFGKHQALPTIEVNGKRTSLETEDYTYGDLIARHGANALRSVIPPLGAGEGGQSSLSQNLAILRRAAIEEGIDVSMTEVDRAIEFQRQKQSADSTAAQFAQLQGFPSLAQYREVMREAMRIGNYVRLQTLVLDGSNSLVIEKLLRDKEKITLRVATFDEKAAEEKLKVDNKVSDDDLHKWLDGKSDGEKAQLQAYDTNRVELKIGALLLAEGQFDPTQWTDVLKDFAPGDEELKSNYEREKEARWKLEGDKYKPFEEVKAELLRILQAEQVMKSVVAKVRDKQNESVKPLAEALQKDQQDVSAAELAVKNATAKAAEKPDDAALQDEVKKAEEALTAKRNAVDAGTKAFEDARSAWDFKPAFEQETAGKTGFVVRQTNGRKNGEDLKNLDADGLDLGKWPSSLVASSLQRKGDLTAIPSRTTKASIVFQATDVEVRPLKTWDKLKPLVEGAWYVEKAKKLGEEKKKAFEDALLRLAKAKMPEKVAELEGKRAERTDKELGEWEKRTRDEVAVAEKTLAGLTAGTQAQRNWTKKLDALKTELDGKDGKRVSIDLETGKQIENEIAEEAKKHYHEVIDAAAADAGFTVADLGPFPRELSSRPRFDKAYDPTVVFLWRSHAKLKEHETTGVVQDQANRRWLFGVCTKIEPMTVADLTRREFESLRTGNGFLSFATLQALVAYQQAFTQEALHKRYAFQQAAGTQVVDGAPARDGAAK